MVIRVGAIWHCYYTAHPDRHGADYLRTSSDLLHWSEARIVAARGQAGDGPYAAECPFVVQPQPGHFFLFRTQHYGESAKTSVYHSRDPLDFGIDDDAGHFVTTPVAAPRIQHDGKWLSPRFAGPRGIQIAPLEGCRALVRKSCAFRVISFSPVIAAPLTLPAGIRDRVSNMDGANRGRHHGLAA
jgi:hypothetical protein